MNPFRRGPIFYGWVIVASMFLVNYSTMATGTLNFGPFVVPMGEGLDMSRADFGWAQTTRNLTAGLSALMVGRLLDRYGSRLFIVAAAAVIGLCLLAISQVSEAWQFFLLFGVIGVTGVTAPNSLVTSVPVAKWFVRLRGRALALSTLGLGVGGVTLVPITQFLIDEEGWRAAWGIMAIAFMVICIPVAALFLRRQPEDMGLEVDGGPRPAGSRPISNTSAASRIAASEQDAWTLAEARHESTLWKLMAVFALHGLAQGGASVHRFPFWTERGIDAQTVSFAFSVDAAGATAMILLSGWLVERFPVRFLGVGAFIGFASSTTLMVFGTQELHMFASTLIFGSSVGAFMIVPTYMMAEYYGRAFLGAIRGVVLPVTLLTAGAGAPLVGYMRDITGDYGSSWWMILGLYGAAALLMTTVRPPKPRARDISSRTLQG